MRCAVSASHWKSAGLASLYSSESIVGVRAAILQSVRHHANRRALDNRRGDGCIPVRAWNMIADESSERRISPEADGDTVSNQAKMEVKLVDYAQLPLEKLYAAFRTCYSSDTPIEVWEKIRTEKISHETIRKFIGERLKTGHASPLEQVVFCDTVPLSKSSAVMTPDEERCSRWQWLSMAPGRTSLPAAWARACVTTRAIKASSRAPASVARRSGC